VTIPTHSPCCTWLRSFTDLSPLSKACPEIFACCSPLGLGISTMSRSSSWDSTLDQPLPKPGWLRSTYAGQDICVSASPLPVHCVSIFIPSGRGYFSLAVCPSTSCAGALRCLPHWVILTQGRSRRASLGDALPPLFITTEIFWKPHSPGLLLMTAEAHAVERRLARPLAGGWNIPLYYQRATLSPVPSPAYLAGAVYCRRLKRRHHHSMT